jgi:uncharacterized membrane protein YeiH
VLVFAYLGALTRSVGGSLRDLAAGRLPQTSARHVLLAVSAAAIIATAVVLARIARQALRDSVGQAPRA